MNEMKDVENMEDWEIDQYRYEKEGVEINPSLSTDVIRNAGSKYPDGKVVIEHPCPDTNFYPWDTPNELFGRILSKHLYGGRNGYLIGKERISGRYWDEWIFEKAIKEFEARNLGKARLFISQPATHGGRGEGFVMVTIEEHSFPMEGRLK
jgi:hypothetical protein